MASDVRGVLGLSGPGEKAMDHSGDKRYVDSGDRSRLAQDEAWVTWLAWLIGIITVLLVSVPLVFIVFSGASGSSHYLRDGLLVALPVIFGVPAAAYVRHQHISVLLRFQAQLVMRTATLQEVATHDELTRLYNRRYFYEQLQEAIERARVTKQPLALLLADADGLKGLNDNYGHRVGDAVLKNLAAVMTKHVRASDVVARLGGDEFGIILPETDKRGAFGLAHRLLRDLGETPVYQEDGITVRLNISIGVSGYPWGGDDVDQMIHWADADMYANKVSRKLELAPWAKETVPDIDAAPGEYA